MDVRDQPKAGRQDRQGQIYSTSLSVQYRGLLRILKYLIPILLAKSIYDYLDPQAGTRLNESDHAAIVLPDIPVSKVLKHNLQIANRSQPWDYTVLTHALLELQNPEFTVFAGPGIGVHLKRPAGLSRIEPFPGGKLPRAQRTSSGKVGGGRYDWWGRVKGLRTAKSVIDTTIEIVDADGRKTGMGTLMANGSALETAGLGWATLLLGWAGADDPSNPVVGLDQNGAPRNAYLEAADRQARCLFDDTGLCNVQCQTSRVDTGADGLPLSNGKAISYGPSSAQLRPEGVFMFAPFLAGYAVLKQDPTWLSRAIEQVELYSRELSALDPAQPTCHGAWRDSSETSDVSLSSTAWALAGTTWVLATVAGWQGYTTTQDARTRLLAIIEPMVHCLLGLASQVPRDELGEGDVAGSALLAASLYRLAVLEPDVFNEPVHLTVADILYDAVSRHISPGGGTSVGHSAVLMMWASRRDCVAEGICRVAVPQRRSWMSTWFQI